MTEFGLIIAYVLTAVAVLGATILPLVKAMSNPKVLVKLGISIAALLVVFGIGYTMSGSEVTTQYEIFGVDESSSKFIGGTLITMYILVVVSLVGILYTEVNKLFK